ncbi:MAG: hypothetical protein ACYDH1_03655 [Anaerolineaceae bacterium]
MDHQPFEDWILDESSINQEQKESLSEHLNQCTNCAQLSYSWKKVESELISARMISPNPGFVNRFQSNLIARKAEAYQAQSIKSLLIIGSSILFVMGSLITWLFLTKTPGEIIVKSVTMFTGVTEAYINLRYIVLNFFSSVPPYLPYVFLIFTIGWGLILLLIWGLTIWRFSRKGLEQK